MKWASTSLRVTHQENAGGWLPKATGSPSFPWLLHPPHSHACASSRLKGCSRSQISLARRRTRSPSSWDEVCDPHVNPARCHGSGEHSQEHRGARTYRGWVTALFCNAVSQVQNATGSGTSGCVTSEHCSPGPTSVLPSPHFPFSPPASAPLQQQQRGEKKRSTATAVSPSCSFQLYFCIPTPKREGAVIPSTQ